VGLSIPEKNRKYKKYHVEANRVKRKKKRPEIFRYLCQIVYHKKIENIIEKQ